MSTSSANPTRERLRQAAQELGMWLLKSGSEKVVFAESCTAGLVAAELATVAGISQHLCGSMVTYREPSKTAWLGVEPQALQEFSAVSQEVTEAMATGVLQRTNEASWSAAVTGHLGPGAPASLDGQVFITVARREPNEPAGQIIKQIGLRLRSSSRTERQAEAAAAVLETLAGELQRASAN
ncbi:MAG: CinA family protein [Planctomycetota bacterium]